MNVEKIIVVKTTGADTVMVFTDLSEPTFPYTGKLILDFRSSPDVTEQYLNTYFEGISVEWVDQMVEAEAFKSFCDKHFQQNDLVLVNSLGGENINQTFKALVCGIYAFPPFEHYIVQWIDRPKSKDIGNWSCSVVSKNNMKLLD